MEPPPLDRVYASLEEAETEIFAFAHRKGYSLSRLRSKVNKGGEKRKVWLACAQAGDYRNVRDYLTEETRKRKTSSCKTKCTFCVVLQRFVTEPDAENALGKTEWRLELENGEHNHPAATDISAYPAARRLKGDEQQTIREMSDAGADPKVILATVRQRNPECALIVKDIYNQKAQLRNVDLNGRTPLEKLLDDMQSDGVLHVYERDAEGRITRLFFALPFCVALAREFYHVLLMDATYKTNK